MSFSLGGLASAIGSAGNISQSLLGSTGWLSYSSAKSLSKRTLAQQVAAEERLARELPSAQVEGLRNANLNPILAVSHGLSTPSVGNGATTSPSSIDNNPVAEFLSMRNVAAQNDLLKAQKDSINANTSKTLVDTYNNFMSGGQSGIPGIINKIESTFGRPIDSNNLANAVFENLKKRLGVQSSHTAHNNVVSPSSSSHSAKSRDDEDMSVILNNGDSYHFKKGENDPYKILKGSRFLRNGR